MARILGSGLLTFAHLHGDAQAGFTQANCRRLQPFAKAIPLVILVATLYAAVVLLALAWCCLPGLRARLNQAAMQALTALAQRCRSLASVAGHSGSSNRLGGRLRSSMPAIQWPQFKAWHGLMMALFLAVPMATLLLRQQHAYDGFDHTQSRSADARISGLLHGEQLVPPARLPPDLFTTHEVEKAHPLAASANRQWELLNSDFRQRLLSVFKVMREEHGYEMVLIEGYRSPERQQQLFQQGPHVTHAGAGQSYHQYGRAADCAFLKDGRIVISERDAWAARGYALYGAVAQSAGLEWGGGWRKLQDLGHVELRHPDGLQSLAAR